MGYLLKACFGGGLFLGSVALFNVKLVALLETGTCASGNSAFEISRPCPEGAEADSLLLVASVFAGLIGAAIFSVRGRPPWRQEEEGAQFGSAWTGGLLAWGIFFGVTGVVALYHSLTSETIGADGELGGAIVGGTFLLIGLPVLIGLLWWGISGLSGRRDDDLEGMIAPVEPPPSGGPGVSAPPAAPAPVATADDDQIGRLERLQRLRESGALTETEFQLQKGRILNR